ncbi:phosphatidylserine decarboxylase family protein [Christiangramia sabulilitoris]|uniref:Phosphatidylserine decarboxylase proenzyme n=1 Tax=Christiangramia sabulilitoris TaxID=2583991 RepID=A0A550I3K9_9FLAO|nr:phosphatidylserine decarboxylase family protein [Christiangramia sabulilitoris]TRO65560.1 phosphatidylserine decarboxylase family protein [Christiangramia sabulilitoris]
MFHKEGYKIMTVTAIILIAINMISYNLIDTYWIKFAILVLSILFFLLIIQFFRNPKRAAVHNNEHIVSPVDGKVVAIEEVYEKEYFKDKRLQISIFMSPINVHVTRHPVGGKVTYSKYHPGKFLVAWHPKSSEENERTTVVVKNEVAGEILYRQIAGALAKRIVNYAEVDTEVVQGSDSGFIKFGSRVDVFVPIGTKVKVEINQKVKGAVSVIADVAS